MSTRAPDQTDVLCENCGYILNGLAATGNCPECGSPFDQLVETRHPPLWEYPRPSWPKRFLITTWQLIVHPSRFFRSMTAHGLLTPADLFAQIHWIIAALLFAAAGWMHLEMYNRMLFHYGLWHASPPWWTFVLIAAVVYMAISLTVHLAARLSAWEGAYRGYRLPYTVVMRALYYHAAHLLPVAVLAVATVGGYRFLELHGLFDTLSFSTYLYVLAGEVVVSAVYLFDTYWIAMKKLMYANR